MTNLLAQVIISTRADLNNMPFSIKFVAESGGEGGIRTHDTVRYTAFRERRVQPCSATSPRCQAYSRQRAASRDQNIQVNKFCG